MRVCRIVCVYDRERSLHTFKQTNKKPWTIENIYEKGSSGFVELIQTRKVCLNIHFLLFFRANVFTCVAATTIWYRCHRFSRRVIKMVSHHRPTQSNVCMWWVYGKIVVKIVFSTIKTIELQTNYFFLRWPFEKWLIIAQSQLKTNKHTHTQGISFFCPFSGWLTKKMKWNKWNLLNPTNLTQKFVATHLLHCSFTDTMRFSFFS